MNASILITSGGTRESIDGVRFIGNFSTGTTGAHLADAFVSAGWNVTLLRSFSAKMPRFSCTQFAFESFSDLNEQLQTLLSRSSFRAVLHLAAVSDFTPDRIIIDEDSYAAPLREKVPSAHSLTIQCKPTFKIVDRLKSYALSSSPTSSPTIVAFKLTHTDSEAERHAAIRALSRREGIDFVVHNEFSSLTTTERHPYAIYRREQLIAEGKTKTEMARDLLQLLKEEPQG